MNTYNTKSAITVQVASIVLISVLVMQLSGLKLEINWELVKRVPTIISIYTALYLLFINWLWRWKIFSGWLVLIPDLQGTWKGEIRYSRKQDGKDDSATSSDAFLVIRQTLRSINVKVLTAESTSTSRSASIQIDDASGTKSLDYSYLNRPSTDFRDRSEIHFGAATIEITLKPDKQLKGDYWTDRKTRGSMDFVYYESKLIERFPRVKTD